jgi:SAM-dependent methyltransferase
VKLLSPTSGRPLTPAGAHALRDDDGERWPVIAGIPYLRVGRRADVERMLRRLDDGDEHGALLLALADQDDWDESPAPDPAACDAATRAPTLRAALASLGFGSVADYLAYRWSDPTFVSGLGLLDAAAHGARRVFELACGIGPFLRELRVRGIAAAGGDVVFAKLWLARRFVVPDAEVVCFDAAAPFPLADATAELCLCHDALHYLPDCAHAIAELRRIGGRVLVGHAHNAAVENLSPGAPLAMSGYAALVPGAAFYDDAAVARAALAGSAPASVSPEQLEDVAAVAFVSPAPRRPAPTATGSPFSVPPPAARLRLNPLLNAEPGDPAPISVRWPSRRYEQEYAALSDYLRDVPALPRCLVEDGGDVRMDAGVEELARRRVLLDLPEAW